MCLVLELRRLTGSRPTRRFPRKINASVLARSMHRPSVLPISEEPRAHRVRQCVATYGRCGVTQAEMKVVIGQHVRHVNGNPHRFRVAWVALEPRWSRARCLLSIDVCPERPG